MYNAPDFIKVEATGNQVFRSGCNPGWGQTNIDYNGDNLSGCVAGTIAGEAFSYQCWYNEDEPD